MGEQRFAICVVFSGTDTDHIVNATIRHNVQIVGKEYYDPAIVYSRYMVDRRLSDGNPVMLLFVFPDKNSLLVKDDKDLKMALQCCMQV